MTIEIVKTFSSHLISLFVLPISFLMVFQLLRRWIT